MPKSSALPSKGTAHSVVSKASTLVLALLCLASGTTSQGGTPDNAPQADLVVMNAKVFTSESDHPWARAEAVAVKGERIVFVGDDRGVSGYIGPNTRVVNARGRMVTPGFVDNHCHVLWMGAMMSMMADLYPVATFAQFTAGVLKYANDHPANPFVMAIGWRFEYLPGGVPTRELADAILADRPLFLWAAIGHVGWVNSRAIELMQTRNAKAFWELTPELDAHGKPTGVFQHFYAFNPFDYFRDDEFGPEARERMFDSMRRILDEALRFGVTTMNDVQIYESFIPAILEFKERGGLDNVRVRASYYVGHHAASDFEELKRDLAAWKDVGETHSDGHLVLGDSVKAYIDGISANYTSFMLQPFSNSPGHVGYALWTQEDFNTFTQIVDAMGLQAATHGVGDAGIRRIINGYEYAARVNGRRDARHRIEHMPLPHPDDWHRLAALGIHGAMQPSHVYGDEKLEAALGIERLNRTMPWRSLERVGAEISFGSDWVAAPINPVYGLLQANLRLNYKGKVEWAPEERISLPSAIRHYTID
jgi:predicted amidohydrolase YtcJ